MSEFYNVRVRVYEVSPAIKLTIRFDKSVLASSRGLPSPDSRHRKDYYNSKVRANATFPLPWHSSYQSKTDIVEGHVAKYSGTGEPREKPQGGGVFIWASLRNFQIKTPPYDLIFQYFCFS